MAPKAGLRICLSISIAVLCLSSGSAGGTLPTSVQSEEKVCYYLITQRTDSVLREVYILIDRTDFTEPRLRRLIDQFRERPEPTLFVFLYSRLDQLYNFRGNEPGGSGPAYERNAPKPRDSNSRGILIFRGGDEVIRYNRPGNNLETIVVKGVDPAASDPIKR